MGVPRHITLKAKLEADSIEDLVIKSDVIFCGVPSTTPLFPASYLTSEKARQKTRYISAIGSYRLDMQEIDPELLKILVDPRGIFKDQVYQGKVAVDSVEGCLLEAGELNQANVRKDGMLEVGRIQQWRNSEAPNGLETWLQSGFVVYKSVGVGIMDIGIGSKLLEIAKERGKGMHLNDF